MKIKSINIISFGGLKNLKLDLNGNFNVIYGDNENGKTTVMTFIKMMFYGSERGGAQLSKNLRKKYTPWDSSPMAGSIDFEHKNRNYRLEREFRSSNSTDKVTLLDLDLGERQLVASDIGAELFSLSASAFERSVFIGQFGFPESNAAAEGELNSKLSNIALTGDEDVSFEQVHSRLEKAKLMLMSKSGRAGEYDKNIKTLAEYNKLLEKAQDLELQAEQIKKAVALQDQAKQKKLLQSQEIKSRIDREQDFRNAEKLKELLNLKSQLDELNRNMQMSNGELVDEMFIRKVKFCLSKAEGDNQKISAKQSQIKLIKDNLELVLNPSSNATPQQAEIIKEKINKLENSQSELEKNIALIENTPKAKAPLLPIICLLVAVICAVLLILKPNAAAVIATLTLGAVSLLGLIFSTLFLKSKRASSEKKLLELKLQQNQIISLLASEKASLNAINTALNSNTGLIENQKQQLLQYQADLEVLLKEKQDNLDTLFATFAPFKNETDISRISLLLEEIKILSDKQRQLKQNINYILKDVGNITYDEAEKKLKDVSFTSTATEDFTQLKLEYDELLNEISEITSSKAALTADLKLITSNMPNREALEKEISALKKKTNSQKEFCNALDTAANVLQESFAEVRRSYGSALEKTAAAIFSKITNGKYQDMSISKSFDINVEAKGVFGGKELEYLSSGTADQAYLSLRLALLELMDLKLPVFMDDSLAQFDDNRAKTALTFLKQYSEAGQIIMFTCHHTLADTAKQLGAESINL